MDGLSDDNIGREIYWKGGWTPEGTEYTLKFCNKGGTKRLAWFANPEFSSQILLPSQQKELFAKYGNYSSIYNGFTAAWDEDKKPKRRGVL